MLNWCFPLCTFRSRAQFAHSELQNGMLIAHLCVFPSGNAFHGIRIFWNAIIIHQQQRYAWRIQCGWIWNSCYGKLKHNVKHTHTHTSRTAKKFIYTFTCKQIFMCIEAFVNWRQNQRPKCCFIFLLPIDTVVCLHNMPHPLLLSVPFYRPENVYYIKWIEKRNVNMKQTGCHRNLKKRQT